MDPCLESLKTIIENDENNFISATLIGASDNALRIVSRRSTKKTFIAQSAEPYAIRLYAKITPSISNIKFKKNGRWVTVYQTLAQLCSKYDVMLVETSQMEFGIAVIFPCTGDDKESLKLLFNQYLGYLEEVLDTQEQIIAALVEKIHKWTR